MSADFSSLREAASSAAAPASRADPVTCQPVGMWPYYYFFAREHKALNIEVKEK